MDSITQFISQHCTLSEDQKKVTAAVSKFLDSNEVCFLLKGFAGTGKTFLIGELIRYLSQTNYSLEVMAPTGRAAQILRDKTKADARTIHSSIYNLNDIDEIKFTKDGKEKFKYRFNLKSLMYTTQTVLLIDESSMISDTLQEDDFFTFGSGKLLSDIFERISLFNTDRKIKIIFIGDSAQLPPIGDNFSCALSETYLEKFGLTPHTVEMQQVLRQNEDNGILTIATYLRNKLLEQKRNEFKIDTNQSGVHLIASEAAVPSYLSLIEKHGMEQVIMIHYRNLDARDYNVRIREFLFPGHRNITAGDRIIVAQNNYRTDPPLLNGMIVKVKETDPIVIQKNGMLAYDADGNKVYINMCFRKIWIELVKDHETFVKELLIIDDFLEDEKPTLGHEQNTALYLDFKLRNSHLKPKTLEFKEALKNDPFFNAVRAKYGYAITCHKAQGGEWKHVLVNMYSSQGKKSDNHIRWTYTAITRARKELYLFNLINETAYSKMVFNMKPGKAMQSESPITTYHPAETFEETCQRLGQTAAPGFIKIHLEGLMARTEPLGIKITAHRKANYQEQYRFEKEGNWCQLQFWYNGKNQFTKVNIESSGGNSTDFTASLLDLVQRPVHYKLMDTNVSPVVNEEPKLSTYQPKFSELEAHLEKLYEGIQLRLEAKKIQVINLEHQLYKEMYTLQKGSLKFRVDFYYNAKNEFTTVDPQLIEGLDDATLVELAEIVEDFKTAAM